jgi:DinB superfamily
VILNDRAFTELETESFMNSIELLVRNLKQSEEMLKMTLADFSESDMLQRPVAGANHPLWQLGHLCVAETNLMNSILPGAMPELPAGFADRFANRKTNHIDDPAQLATKAQVVELFGKVRAATIAAISKLTEADLDKPGPEKFRAMFPTLGDIAAAQASHLTMHLGQFQVTRRKLGKAILF